MCNIFSSLLERPLIKRDFNANFPKLIVMMEEELGMVKKIYDLQVDRRANLLAINNN